MKALIADNKVIEIAETEFEVNPNWQWVDCDDSITTRHTYEDGTFTAPTTVEKTFAQKRIEEYPSIGDQLDMQYWDAVNGTTTWKDAIAQVKADNPKPQE